MIVIIIIVFMAYFVHYRDKVTKKKRFDLEKHGFEIFERILVEKEVNEIKELCENQEYKSIQNYLSNQEKMKTLITRKLNENYLFQDYIWIIEKSSVHTCHRDNNGDFFNANQQNPSYTMLVYLEDMPKALGVIPKSHKDKNWYMNIYDPLLHVGMKKGDVILFNANLIHVGTINDKHDHLRIQLKVTHKDDLEAIRYYENFHKVLRKENKNPYWLRKAQKRLSCMFPFISDLVQEENIRSARGSDNGAEISTGQKIFSNLYYGDSTFYDLPNAF